MFSKSIEAYNKAKKIIPGGVNSPVRAFRSVNSTPIFFKSGKFEILFGSIAYDPVEVPICNKHN